MTKQPKVRKAHPVLHGIGLALSAILLVAVLAGTYVLFTMATIIDSFIGAPSGNYSETEIADTKLKAEALAAEVEAEGTVLVQNKDNTLPLNADTKKVNVFGWASTAWLGGGSGSGGVNAVNTDLLAALTAYGIEYNTELTDMYKDFQPGREYIRTLNSRPEQSGRLYEPDINNTTYYTQSMLDNAKNYSDTAVVVIGRLAGESNDATKQQYKRTEKGGDIVVDDTRTMLELTTEEENLLTYVGANYKNVVVLVNSTNVMELGQLETIPGVDACLIAGLSGSEAASVIPAVLWGEKEPSGRTADTWAYDLTTAASYANAGLEGVGAYTAAEGLYPADGTTCGNLDAPYAYEQVSYVDYAEGIYIGYKWYETADAEGYWSNVSNEYGTGYDGVVQYPFGYGLSYTSFDWAVTDAAADGSTLTKDGDVTVKVTVTNTGDRAGKDVVQLYYTAPYITGEIEKSSVELGAFAKTKELQPGESRSLIFVLGYIENPEDEKWAAPGVINKTRAQAMAARYATDAQVDAALARLHDHWNNLLSTYSVKSSDEKLDRMVNTWNQYQCMVTFNMSRSASYYESGTGRGMGFRDSCQDLLGFVHLIPARARERILDIAATQFPDGSAYHQYQPLTKKGNMDIGSGFNDDPLWLIAAVYAYLGETGDYSILDEPVDFDNDHSLAQPLLEHLRRSFGYLRTHKGPHGLPLIGRADWNDCLNLNCFSKEPGESFQTTGPS